MATYGNPLNVGGVQVSAYNHMGNYPGASKEYLVMQQPLQAFAGVPQRLVTPPVSSTQGLWIGAQDSQQRIQQIPPFQHSAPMTSQPMMVMRSVPPQPQIQRQVQPQVIRVQQQQPQFVQLQQQQPQMVQMPTQQKAVTEIVYINVNGVVKQGIVQNGSVYLLESTVGQAAPARSVPSRPTMNGMAQAGVSTVLQLAPTQVQVPARQQVFQHSGPMYIQQQPQHMQQSARFTNTAGAQGAMKPLASVNTSLQAVQIQQQQQVPVQYTAAAVQSSIANHQPLVIGHASNQAPRGQLVLARAQPAKPPIQPLVISSAASAGQHAPANSGGTALVASMPEVASAVQPVGAVPAGNRLLSTAALVRGLTAGEGHAPVSGATAAMAPGAAAGCLPLPVARGAGSLPMAAALAPQQLLQPHSEAQAGPAATSALVAAASAAAAVPVGGSPGSGAASRVLFNPTAKGSVGVIGDTRRSREDGTSGPASGTSTPKAPASATGSRPATPQPMPVVPAGAATDLASAMMDNNLQQVWGVLTEEARRCGVSLESLAMLGGSPNKNQTREMGTTAVPNESVFGVVLDGPMNGATVGADVPGFNAFGFSFFGASDVAGVMEGHAPTTAASGARLSGAEHKLGDLLQGLNLGPTV